MRKFFLIIAGIILGACPAYADNGNQVFGTLTGAMLGGIAGNQFGHGNGRVAATAAGVVAGGWIGNDVGYALDNSRTDSPPTGGSRILPSGGTSALGGAYKPNYVAPDDTPAYDTFYGDTCRAYSEQVRIGDQVQENYGTACLQPDGTWRAVDE